MEGWAGGQNLPQTLLLFSLVFLKIVFVSRCFLLVFFEVDFCNRSRRCEGGPAKAGGSKIRTIAMRARRWQYAAGCECSLLHKMSLFQRSEGCSGADKHSSESTLVQTKPFRAGVRHLAEKSGKCSCRFAAREQPAANAGCCVVERKHGCANGARRAECSAW